MALSENQKKYIVDSTEAIPVLIAVEGKRENFPSSGPVCFPQTLTLTYSFWKKNKSLLSKRKMEFHFTLFHPFLMQELIFTEHLLYAWPFVYN